MTTFNHLSRPSSLSLCHLDIESFIPINVQVEFIESPRKAAEEEEEEVVEEEEEEDENEGVEDGEAAKEGVIISPGSLVF